MDKKYIIDLVASLIGDNIKAEIVVERLQEEGVLHLGHGNAEIDRIVDKFQETFGTTKISKYDRFAANRLAAKYGTQAVIGIIQLLGSLMTEKYAPVPRNVADMETKLASILSFLRKTGNNDTIQL